MQPHPAFAPLVDLIFPPRCPLCGEGLAAQSGLCATCWAELEIPTELADERAIAAAVRYNDAARKLVLAFKRGRRIALAPMLARLMNARLGEMEDDWVAVPVPLHRTRLWQRGLNQSAMLAREIGRLRGCGLMVDGLIRRKRTPSLGGLGAAERKAVLEGAIIANPSRLGELRDAKVLLVDDVHTSGATTQACAAALRGAGIRSLRIVCFARVDDDP